MKIIELLLNEFDREVKTTRKMLSIVPDDKYDWQPHEKSMKIRQLATHIAELPTWIPMTLDTQEIDFMTSKYKPKQIANTKELMEYFEQSLVEGRENLEKSSEEQLNEEWTMRSGEEIYEVAKKHKFIRDFFSQVTHHRAQLGVYLRLLDVPIPGSYGPSADDMSF